MQRFLIALMLLTSTQAGLGQGVTGQALLQWVKGIEGKNPEGRRQFVRDELKKMGVRFTGAPFARERHTGGTTSKIEGENILVTIGEGTRSVIVGAHMDAVAGSPGANDNGGGVAVLLGLLQSTKDVAWKYRLTFCFYDQEEAGLIGSAEFVKSYKDTLEHLAMINLDVEGIGEEAYVGPVGGGDDDLIMPYVRRAAATAGVVLRESPHYPPSDHLSFANRRLENISISIVPKGDVALLNQAIQNNWQIDEKKTPHVMKTMHTPRDRSSTMSGEALKKSYTIVQNLLLLLNEREE